MKSPILLRKVDAQERQFTVLEIASIVGVSTSTIRAWERRYKFFSPARTKGGHRLYTYDDLRLFWYIVHLRKDGQSLKKLSKLNREQLIAGAASYFDLTSRSDPRGADATDTSTRDLLDLLKQGKLDEALEKLEQLFSLTTDPLQFCDLALTILTEVGEAWCEGTLSVASENAVTKRIKYFLLTYLYAKDQTPADAPLAVCALLPGELHDVGLLRVAIYLKSWGYRVQYFGAHLPLKDLTGYLDRSNASLLCMSVTKAMPSEKRLKQLEQIGTQLSSKYVTVIGGCGIREFASNSNVNENLLLLESMKSLKTVCEVRSDRGLSVSQAILSCREKLPLTQE